MNFEEHAQKCWLNIRICDIQDKWPCSHFQTSWSNKRSSEGLLSLQSLHLSIFHQYFLPFHVGRCSTISEKVSKPNFLVSGSWWSRHFVLKQLYPASANPAKTFKRECRYSISYALPLSKCLEYNFPLLSSSSVVEKVKKWL